MLKQGLNTACDYTLGDGTICGCWDPEWTGTECGTVVSWGDCGTEGGTPPVGTTNPDTTYGDTGTGGSGNTGGSDTGASDPGNTTSPTLDPTSPEYLRKKNFIRNQLNPDQRGWFNDQTAEVQNVIIDYLENQYLNDDIISNEYPEDAAEFAGLAIEALEDEGSVDFENEVIIYETFKDSEPQCIHNLLKANSTFYSEMLSNFSLEDARGVLTLKIGATLNGDWGTTSGSYDNFNEFVITTSNDIESSSNLKRMVTLSHELIHAYMFSSLESWGLISYDISEEPILNVVCVNGTNYNSLNLNTLDSKDRFVAIICAFNQNNTLTEDWTHDLFNVWTFDVNTYRDLLKDLLVDSNDWSGENEEFKNEAIYLFGANNWIEKVSEAISWIGLENTQEYTNYFNSIANPLEQLYILDIRNEIQSAKSNCL